VARVHALVGRWNSGDHTFEGLPEQVDPAFELEGPLSSVAGEPYRGYAGIEAWARDLDEQFAEWSIGLEDVRQVGDQVIAIATIDARGRASDITLRFRSASVVDFGRDGRILRLHIYQDGCRAQNRGAERVVTKEGKKAPISRHFAVPEAHEDSVGHEGGL
jgi:ketosteroid isomerase-like protein